MEPLIIKELSSRFYFSEYTIQAIERAYPNNSQETLQALKGAPPQYSIRVNSLKAKAETVAAELRAKNIDVTFHPSIDDCLLIKVQGPREVPIESQSVVVDKLTAEAVLLGAHVYAPGIKRCQGIRKNDRVNVIDECGQIVASGIARLSEIEILSERSGLAVEITDALYRVPSVRETTQFREGLIFPQSVPAIVAGHVLNPQPGEQILDMNCAPGGKLSYICQLTKNQARIIGVDRKNRKINATKQTITRLGCKGLQLVKHDARYLDKDFPNLQADKVLVDPPCSAPWGLILNSTKKPP